MKNPIRILHVLGGLDRGGAETMVMNLYRNIDRSKVQFDFVIHYPEKNSYVPEIKNMGGKVHYITNYRGINHLQYTKEWHELLKKYPNYRVIHSHIRSTASIFLKIARKNGLITIAHSHNTSNGKGLEALIKRAMQKSIKDIADYMLAPSLEAGKWLFGKDAIKEKKFFILKNAINAELYSFNSKIRTLKKKELNITDEIVIGHVGRFEEQKNHEFLIQIFKQFHKINNNSLLVLIGVGKLEEEIKKQVNNSKLENNVLFLGERADVNELMQAMDVFVFPSFYEGLGIVAIEAQTSGMPTIVSNSIPEEVKITNLLEFKSLNSNATNWAKRIDTLKNKARENKYKDVKKAGYDIQDTSRKLQSFYLGL